MSNFIIIVNQNSMYYVIPNNKVLSYLILSYLILSYLILSYLMKSFIESQVFSYNRDDLPSSYDTYVQVLGSENDDDEDDDMDMQRIIHQSLATTCQTLE